MSQNWEVEHYVDKLDPATKRKFHPTNSQDESLGNFLQKEKLKYKSTSTRYHESEFHGRVKAGKKAIDNRPITSRHHFEVLFPLTFSFINEKYSMDQFAELVSNVHNDNIDLKHRGVIGIRKLISVDYDPPIQQVIDAQLIPILIEMSKQSIYPQLQL